MIFSDEDLEKLNNYNHFVKKNIQKSIRDKSGLKPYIDEINIGHIGKINKDLWRIEWVINEDEIDCIKGVMKIKSMEKWELDLRIQRRNKKINDILK